MSAGANTAAHAAMIAARPELCEIAPLRELVPNLPAATLLHAGPPLPAPDAAPAPLMNAIVAAARHEGLATDAASTRAALSAGDITLAPAQDFGVVTPLAFVAGASMFALCVRDPVSGVRRVSPLNDGPLPHALRFGTGADEGLALVRRLTDGIGAELAAAFAGPVPFLPLCREGLLGGDDLHGRVAAAQSAVRGWFGPLPDEAEDYLAAANQFVLNVLMAGAATMLGAAAGVAGSRLVVAAGGNGRDFGWKLSAEPSRWITAPARPPVGPLLPAHADRTPLPAIGDSAVIDAVGFGAACLRYAPELAASLDGHVDRAFFGEEAHAAFHGPHPELPESVRVGLDPHRPRTSLGIMLGMVDSAGETGLVGRGIAPWPVH